MRKRKTEGLSLQEIAQRYLPGKAFDRLASSLARGFGHDEDTFRVKHDSLGSMTGWIVLKKGLFCTVDAVSKDVKEHYEFEGYSITLGASPHIFTAQRENVCFNISCSEFGSEIYVFVKKAKLPDEPQTR